VTMKGQIYLLNVMIEQMEKEWKLQQAKKFSYPHLKKHDLRVPDLSKAQFIMLLE
jgi:hypothetical protein